MQPKSFATLFDTNVVPIQLIDCIADLLRYDPKARLTTQECLDSAYFREVAYRYAPYRPASVRTNTTPSITTTNGSHRASSSLSISTAGSTHVPPMPSPRELPPSHSNRDSAHVQPPFRPAHSGQQLPPVSGGGFPFRDTPAATPGNVPRHDSDTSMVSGMSGYAMHVNPPAEDGSYDSPMTYPESVNERTSPTPASIWSGQTDPSSWGGAQGRAAPPFGAASIRRGSFSGSIAPSLAASTYYDGSVFEGVGSQRAPSVMSFPFGNGNMDGGSPTFDDSPTMGNNGAFDPSSAQASTSQQQAQQPPASLAPPQPTKSGRWSGFGKAFSSSSTTTTSQPTASTSASPMLQDANSNPLKRAPSIASSYRSSVPSEAPSQAPSQVPLDPKKAKKEAEKAAKEAEKLKREKQQQAARERARAVMKKKSLLQEAADPLHNYSNTTRVPDVKGKQRALPSAAAAANLSLEQMRQLAIMQQQQANAKMPQIVEDTSRLHVSDHAALRHKARRRDVDDDVHSVSSNETGHSSHLHGQRGGRPFSMSGVSILSVATSASDPERRSQHQYDLGAGPPPRVPSLSSITSSSSRPYHHQSGFRHAVPPPPSTGHSSLDHSLIANMQGLATSSAGGNDGWRSPGASIRSERSESRGARASSPRDHLHHQQERYSPYPFPNGATPAGRSPGPQLPPITTFDPSAYRTTPGAAGAAAAGGSSAASIASFHSTPGMLPSYLGRPSLDTAAGGGGAQQRQYALASDSAGLPSGGSTFPYKSPPPTGS